MGWRKIDSCEWRWAGERVIDDVQRGHTALNSERQPDKRHRSRGDKAWIN